MRIIAFIQDEPPPTGTPYLSKVGEVVNIVGQLRLFPICAAAVGRLRSGRLSQRSEARATDGVPRVVTQLRAMIA
jgi:hypothetical protein